MSLRVLFGCPTTGAALLGALLTAGAGIAVAGEPAWQMVIAPRRGAPVVAEFHHQPNGETSVHHRLVRPGEHVGAPRPAFAPPAVVPQPTAPHETAPRPAPAPVEGPTFGPPTGSSTGPVFGPVFGPSARRDSKDAAQGATHRSARPAASPPVRLVGRETEADPDRLVLPPPPAAPLPARNGAATTGSNGGRTTPARPMSTETDERGGAKADAPATTQPPAATQPVQPPPAPPVTNPRRPTDAPREGTTQPPAAAPVPTDAAVLPPGFASPSDAVAVPHAVGLAPGYRPTYAEVYESIPFIRSEYNANPSYRHEATMEILFGQMRPTVIHKTQRPLVEHQNHDYVAPYRSWGDRGYGRYPFYDPRAPIYTQY